MALNYVMISVAGSFGLALFGNVATGPVALMIANVDFYRKHKFGESIWPFLPDLFSKWWVIIICVAATFANYAMEGRVMQ